MKPDETRDEYIDRILELWNGKLPTWDKDKFLMVCADRGYLTERSVVYDIVDFLGLPPKQVRAVMSNGRWKWEQMLILGARFEMTPREFCDVFLSGYFTESGAGMFRASLDVLEQRAMMRPVSGGGIRCKRLDDL